MKKLQIYIAASFPRKNEACVLANMLAAMGHKITSRWHSEDSSYATVEQMHNRAKRDYEDLDACNVFVSLTGDNLTHGGRHAEFGFALAMSKRVILIGEREHVLHWCSGVELYKDVEEFLRYGLIEQPNYDEE